MPSHEFESRVPGPAPCRRVCLERDHGAVRMDGPSADLTDREAVAVIREFDVRIFPAGLGQHLDPLVGGVKVVQVVADFLPLQDYG